MNIFGRGFGRLQRKAGVAGGQVCLAGTGVLVQHVVRRFAAGDSLDELAKDYCVPRPYIDAAVRLVLTVNGVTLTSKRAQTKLDMWIPMLRASARLQGPR